MFEITVQAGFSSGHFLRDYQGKCENPHGHNYRVLVTLIAIFLVMTTINPSLSLLHWIFFSSAVSLVNPSLISCPSKSASRMADSYTSRS